jgi:MFS family permease
MVVHGIYAGCRNTGANHSFAAAMVYDKANVFVRDDFLSNRNNRLQCRTQLFYLIGWKSGAGTGNWAYATGVDEYNDAYFPAERRGSAMGIIGLVVMFAPAIGPTLSGLIIDGLSWRWLFYLVIPIAVFRCCLRPLI